MNQLAESTKFEMSVSAAVTSAAHSILGLLVAVAIHFWYTLVMCSPPDCRKALDGVLLLGGYQCQ